jgi:hypothetical protein
MGFFNVIIKKQTYLNLVYLLLAFPLGIFYFTFLTTGISLGLGLAITLIGIPILALMTIAWYGLGIFERTLSKTLLNVNIAPMSNNALKEKTFWKKLSKHLNNSATWKSLGYLFIKFPLGILSFVVVVTFISVSLSLIASPIVYYLSTIFPRMEFMVINGVELVTSYWPTAIMFVLGVFLLLVSFHLFNGLAYVSGILAKGLLSGKRKK